MLERLPENVRSRPVAKAMFSPSATLLAGAGMSIAILTGTREGESGMLSGLNARAPRARGSPRRPNLRRTPGAR